MRSKRYDAELLRVEIVKDAFTYARAHAGRFRDGPAWEGMMERAGTYPIVISFPYARGISPREITIEEAEELIKEIKTAVIKAKQVDNRIALP